jgi:hypothetical protein
MCKSRKEQVPYLQLVMNVYVYVPFIGLIRSMDAHLFSIAKRAKTLPYKVREH